MTSEQINITDRSKLRMERLRLEELEQQRWEQDALIMPEALNQALLMSFASVKTEFSDLDGLSWPRYPVPIVPNPWAIDEPSSTLEQAYSEHGEFPDEPEYAQRSQTPSPYGVSSYTGLASFASGETTHAPRDTTKTCRSPLQPTQLFTGIQNPESNTSRGYEYTRHMSSSPPTLFHLSSSAQSNGSYSFRQLPSFDAPMHTRISVPSKRHRPNP